MGDSIIGDLRYAVRALARQPALCLLIVLTLGLGIGANGAVFAAFNSLLLRESPFRDVDRLVRITSVRGDEDGGSLSVPELDDIRALSIVEDAALYSDHAMYNASGFGTPEELQATIATHNLFRLLGVEPMIGSTFPANLDRSRNFSLVISHGLWVRKFGRDPNIVGRAMTLDGSPGYTIYGVMPPAFNFPSHSDLFRSSGISGDPSSYQRRDIRERVVVARLKAGVSIEQARSAVHGLGRQLERAYPLTNAGLGFRVTPIRDVYSAGVRPYVLLLFGTVVIVLIVACTNVANLLMSRAYAREREIAVRTALGAGRWRILRHFLAESLVLASAGALVGGALGLVGVPVLAALVPIQLPPWMQIQVDAPVAVFLAAATALTAVTMSLAVGLRRPTSLHHALKAGGRGASQGRQHQRARNVLVVVEVALALVLVVGASLMVQSLWRLHRVDLGFATANTLTFRVQLGWAAYSTLETTLVFHEQVLARLRQLPGVRAVTFDSNVPMSGSPRNPYAIRVVGQSVDAEERTPYVNLHAVGPGYFDVMRIGIRRGRGFDTRDRVDTVPAVVVSERLAQRLWYGRDPIGQQIEVHNAVPPGRRTVVGVSEAVRHHALDREPDFDVYEPYTQVPAEGPYYLIRTDGDPMVIAEAATAVIGAVDPNQSFLDVQTYDRRVATRTWQHRLAAALIGGFAGLALLLAFVGLYGILSYMVRQQTGDIGLRLALGATPDVIARQVLFRGLTLTAAGVFVGLGLAFALARVMGALLYEVSPVDPLTFVGVPCMLLAIAAAACYGPARRATRVDPIAALRAD